MFFCFIFISFKKNAGRPLHSHDSVRKSSKESTKDPETGNTKNLCSATCGF